MKQIVGNFECNKISEKVTNEIIKVLREENGQKAVSYAEVLKVNDPVVVIVPKNGEQKSAVTKKLIKDKIDPANNDVSGIRSGANGCVVVEWKTKAATEQFKEEKRSCKAWKWICYKITRTKKTKIKNSEYACTIVWGSYSCEHKKTEHKKWMLI